MGVVKLYSVSFWMCDLKLDLADILLRAYYTYIEVQIKVAHIRSTLVKLNVSCKLHNSYTVGKGVHTPPFLDQPPLF